MQQQRVAELLEERSEALLALLKRLCCLPALGDVDGNAYDARDLTGIVPERKKSHPSVTPANSMAVSISSPASARRASSIGTGLSQCKSKPSGGAPPTPVVFTD